VRQTVRRLVRTPLFTLVAAGTLAVGIGANVAIFSVIHGVLLRPLPYEAPEELVALGYRAPGLGFDEVPQNPALHKTTIDEGGRVFTSLGKYQPTSLTLTGTDRPRRLDALRVTHGTLATLGVRPDRGRLFTAGDDVADGPLRTVVSHAFWQDQFGGDPDVIGRAVTLDGIPHEIVGVLPRGFRFLDREPDLYVTFRWDWGQVNMGNFSYGGFARLAPGATRAAAVAEVERLIPVAAERFPEGLTLEMIRDAGLTPRIVPLKDEVVGDVGQVLWVLLGMAGMVFLIACANVANLFLVRGEIRQREVAVRTALGSPRRRIVAHVLGESVVLGACGGVVGVLLAWGGLWLLRAVGAGQLPRLVEVGLDPIVLAVAGVLSVVAGVLFGGVALAKYGAPDLAVALKDGGRGAGADVERHRTRNALVVGQVALALVLLVGSGLMVRSFQALQEVDPGFTAPEAVLTARVPVPSAEVGEPLAVIGLWREIAARVAALPEVRQVALAASVPLDDSQSNDGIWVEGQEPPEGQLAPIRRFNWVGPGSFSTLGTPLLAGRDITWDDVAERRPVGIVSASLAREHWGNPAAALGERIKNFPDAEWREVVGVVGDVRADGLDQEVVPTVYWPLAQESFWEEGTSVRRNLTVVARTGGPVPPGAAESLRSAVWAVNPNLPLYEVRTLDQLMEASLARTSFTLVALGVAALVALILGTVGIYGVVSYVVSQRTREIGVRMALGADAGRVRTLVLRQGLRVVLVGVVVGIVAAGLSSRVLATLLFGVDTLDPVTYLAVAALLVLVSVAATWVPAWRASRLDPVLALRSTD
jgi:predicted permease